MSRRLRGLQANKRINPTRRSASPLRGLCCWRAGYAQHVRLHKGEL